MWSLTVCILHVLLLVSLVAGNGWVLNVDDGKNFQASLNSIQLLDHTAEVPMVYIGAGSTVFNELHGNFDVEDSVERRIPLEVISQFVDNRITFTAKSDDSLKVTLTFDDAAEGSEFVELKFSDLPASYDRIWMRFVAAENEHVFGGGEQFTHLNMRGRKFPIWTREQGVGRNKSSLVTFNADVLGKAGGDYHTTYYVEPTYISTRGYLLHSTATYYTILDFTNTRFHELEVHGNVGALKFVGGSKQTVAELSQIYAKSNGLMPSLPEWMYTGAIVGLQGGTTRMNEVLNTIEGNGVKVSAVWIQDWAGKIKTSFGKRVFWNWEWNPTFYPGLDEEIPKLKARGIQVLTYINPYLNIEGPLFKEADALGYFVKNSTDQTYITDFGEFYCGTLDLTYPDAVEWYKRRIVKTAIDLGISGWMADFSEYLMVDNAKFHSGQTALELHNQWPLLWGRLNREAVEEAGKLGEVVYWMRAGYAGLSNYTTLFWAGDQNVDFTKSDGMPSTVPAALSVGLQGIGMTHYDIGCYTSMFGMIRTKELFLRSAESAIFTAAMRTHEGNRPSENWQLYSDADTMKQFARLVNIQQELVAYLKDTVQTYTQTGAPIQRPLFYSYPEDVQSWSEEYEYLLGEDLLVAPVHLPNATTWSCYLPPGTWIHLWSSTEYSGKTNVEVAAPIGQPPVFYKKGSQYSWSKLNIPLVPPPSPDTSTDGTRTEL